MNFTHDSFASRVLFGPGMRARAGDELERLGVRRAVVIAGSRADEAEAFANTLGTRCAGVFAGARMHTPVDVTDKALVTVQSLGADCLVAYGGGSSIGLAKALALRTDLPQLALPTTYSGSEMTAIVGETRDGTKTTQKSPKILPEVVIYDPELTLSLPPASAGPSGMNAMAHAIEALYVPELSPIVTFMATEAVGALGRALPRIIDHPGELAARIDALYGAWLAGACLASAGMAIHHKLCHVLGGAFDLPHAETHSVLLPYTTAFNRDAAPAAMKRIAAVLGGGDAPQALYHLMRKVTPRTSLQALGLKNPISTALPTSLSQCPIPTRARSDGTTCANFCRRR